MMHPQVANIENLTSTMTTQHGELFLRPVRPSPDVDLNLLVVLSHPVAIVSAAPAGSERYLFRHLTNKGKVTKDLVGVQFGERVRKHIREILKAHGV